MKKLLTAVGIGWCSRWAASAARAVAIGLSLVLTPPVLAAPAETLTLTECLRETALHNAQVVQQARGIEQAAGTRLTLRARALPALTVSGILGQQGAQDSATLVVPVRGANGKVANVTAVQQRPSQFIAIGSEALYQPIFDVAIPASWRRGNLEIATAQENYYSVAVAQLHAARGLFNQAIYYREYGTLLTEIDRTYAANVKSTEALVNAGLTGRQALLQAQTQRGNFAPAINTATGTYRTSLTTLLASMGREQGGVGSDDLVGNVRLEGALEDADFPFDPQSAAEQALARRPDLEALRVLSRSLREDARITRAGYYPLVRLYVTGDLLPGSFTRSNRQNSIRSSDNTQVTELRPGARYDWNVVDTGTVRGAAQVVDLSRDQIEIRLARLAQDIPRDLAQLRAGLDDAAATIRATRGNLAAAQDTLNIVAATVAQGTGSQIEFDNAQTGLLTARSTLLAAQLQATNARADFDRVTGGYLRFVPDAEPRRDASAIRSVK